MHTYYNVYEPFSQKEYLFNAEEYQEYKDTYYMRLTKATGEEVFISDENAKEEDSGWWGKVVNMALVKAVSQEHPF